MQVELSAEQVKILLQIIERTNFSGKDVEIVSKLKLDLRDTLKEKPDLDKVKQ